MNRILIYSDFYCDFEIVLTDIPKKQIEHFLFLYANWQDFEINFDDIVENSGYKFKSLITSDSITRYDLDDYAIKENNKYYINEYYIV